MPDSAVIIIRRLQDVTKEVQGLHMLGVQVQHFLEEIPRVRIPLALPLHPREGEEGLHIAGVLLVCPLVPLVSTAIVLHLGVGKTNVVEDLHTVRLATEGLLELVHCLVMLVAAEELHALGIGLGSVLLGHNVRLAATASIVRLARSATSPCDVVLHLMICATSAEIGADMQVHVCRLRGAQIASVVPHALSQLGQSRTAASDGMRQTNEFGPLWCTGTHLPRRRGRTAARRQRRTMQWRFRQE
mmetsp:Transcript_27181/g.69036  ORF Transcript_27181/g.69036 Transcript_27181/m.69036 type:complete len:244 (+) Transcript_27181:106-837(+)